MSGTGRRAADVIAGEGKVKRSRHKGRAGRFSARVEDASGQTIAYVEAMKPKRRLARLRAQDVEDDVRGLRIAGFRVR